jgi:hypothetical protein
MRYLIPYFIGIFIEKISGEWVGDNILTFLFVTTPHPSPSGFG